MTPTMELGHENFGDNRSAELIYPCLDEVWYGLSIRSEEATWKLPNCLSTIQSLSGLPFSP